MAITTAQLEELIHQTSHGHSVPNLVLREVVKRLMVLRDRSDVMASERDAARVAGRIAEVKTALDTLRDLPRAEDLRGKPVQL